MLPWFFFATTALWLVLCALAPDDPEDAESVALTERILRYERQERAIAEALDRAYAAARQAEARRTQ